MVHQAATSLDLGPDHIDTSGTPRPWGSVATQASLQDLVGIGSEWPPDRIKRHLHLENGGKWNDHVSALPERHEQDYAQRMLALITEPHRNHS